MTDPFVKTSEASRVETRQGPDCITQGLMAHYTLSQRLIHLTLLARKEEEKKEMEKETKKERHIMQN